MKLTTFLAIGLLILFPTYQTSGNKTEKLRSSPNLLETYHKVLDLVFPREEGTFGDKMKESLLTLRYKPSFGAETQITITTYKDQRVAEAVIWTLPKTGPSVWDQVNIALGKNAKKSYEDISKELKVEKHLIHKSEKLALFLQHFASLSIPPTLNTSVILDGDKFEMWFETVSNRYYFDLISDRDHENRQTHPLIKWMLEVKNGLLVN